MKLADQLQRHLLAIISLVVAITALSYNTYRNELSEENRTIRFAGFELLKELNSLQLLIDYAHFDKDSVEGNPITGWGHVMYIKDMSRLISTEVVGQADQLGEIWDEEWQAVQYDASSNQRVTIGIVQLRKLVRATVEQLM